MPVAHVNNALEAMKIIALSEPSRVAESVYGAPPAASGAEGGTGSRRRRLWELDSHCHCPLIGVCLPMDVLRRLLNKSLGANALANDYEIHAGAVSEAARRSKLAELMQADLEARYAREIQAFRAAKNSLAVADLWVRYLRAGDVAGAFWAALTHPRCEASLRDAMCKDLHMFQHQAGAGVRLEIARFNALAEENAVLGRELGKVQERITRVMAQKHAELERLQATLVQARAEAIRKDSRLAFMAEDLENLRQSIPDLQEKEDLKVRLERMIQRQEALEAQNADLRRRLQAAERVAQESSWTARQELPGGNPSPARAVVPVRLHQKMVLCVGGRSGNIANYREVVERVGGRFAHHDGGVEDNASVLDASLAAADLVICQTGCISHNAYWRVKDFCKRTGKQCVYVENSSTSTLERKLQALSTPVARGVSPEESL